MRVTSNLFPETLRQQLTALQQQQLDLQTRIASGLRFSRGSEAPVAFGLALSQVDRQEERRSYLRTAETARDSVQLAHTGLRDLQTALSRGAELALRGNGIYAPEELRVIGTELSSVLDLVAGIANRQADGKYLYGGSGNVAPVVQTDPGPPPRWGFNPDPAYTAAVPRADIQPGTTVETALVAGRPGDFDGFLAAGGTDTLAALATLRDQLLAGQPVDTSGPEYTALRSALDLASEAVGQSAGRLAAIGLTEESLRQQIQLGAERLADQIEVPFAEAITDLQRTQFNYQAALQSGARILNLSLLNYLPG